MRPSHIHGRVLLFFFTLMSIVFQPLALSENHINDLLPPVSAKKRPVDLNRISEAELKFLSTQFFRAEESLLKKYENKEKKADVFLPFAITKALASDGDEGMMAKILAELTGSLNKTQINQLKETSQALAKQIRLNEPETRDDRYLTLVERSEWLGYIMAGLIPPSDSLPTSKEEQAFAKFKKEFLEAYKIVSKDNKALLEKIELAKTDPRAKQWLRDRLDTASFSEFMRGQKASGGDSLFQDVAEAVVWKDDLGQKYHDFVRTDGSAQRLYVGKSAEDNAKAFGDYLQRTPNPLKGFSLSPKKVDPKTAKVVNLTNQPLAVPPAASNPPAPSASSGSPAQAVQVFNSKCKDCHLNHDIQMRDLGEAVQRIQSRGPDRMPPPGAPALSEAEKASLIQFFESGESKERFFSVD